MDLVKLDDLNQKFLSDKIIYCFEKNISYLMELKERFPQVYKNVNYVIENNRRYQDEITIDGRVIPIVGINDIIFPKDYSILIISDYYEEAFDTIKKYNLEVDNIYFFANKETETELAYRKKYKNDLLRNLIIFRSGPHASTYVKGMDFADNSRVLFEYMLKNEYNKKYELVWLVNNPDEFKDYNKYKNVKFYSYNWSASENMNECDLYYDALCHAKFLFFTDAYGFARNCRNDQVRIQLWHGCGFKTRTNFVPCERRYEYNIVISEEYKKIHKKIYGLRDDQVIITGYPKEDLLFHPVSKNKMRQLGIPNGKKYIFWLPTFRSTSEQLKVLNEFAIESEVGLPIMYNFEYMEHLNNILVEKDCIMVIKLHPFQKQNSVHIGKLTNVILLENEQLINAGVQINELLAHADALISDYSSAAVDFLILNRPIAFTLDDVEEYNSNRGFVFDNIREWLPGKEIFDNNDLLKYVKEVCDGIDSEKEKRQQIRMKLHNYSDDLSSKRVLDAFRIVK